MSEKKNCIGRIVVGSCAFLSILAVSCLPGLALDDADESEVLKLFMGETKVLSVRNPSRIVIGNPNVADVSSVTKREVLLTPKSAGSTTLVIWDNFGEQSYTVKVFAEDIDVLKARIDTLLAGLSLPEVSSRPAEDEGKVLLLGRVKEAKDKERIATALGALKEKTVDLIEVKEEEAVIEIDVQVLELNKDATKTLGFTWPGSITIASDQAVDTTGAGYTGITPGPWSAIFRISQWSRTNFEFKLDALVQEGKARILSRPRLSCQSGKEAELLVGGEKPIFTTQVASAGGQGTQVEYKEFGIKLKIKPTLTEGERIKLALSVEVSEVGETDVIGPANAPTAKAFPLSKRTASTELFVNDGQTMAIGGLMKQKYDEDSRKVPWLGDAPIIGALFRQKTVTAGGGAGERGDSELFITLTPAVVSKPAEKLAAERKLESELLPFSYYAGAQNLSEPVTKYAAIVQHRILENLTYPLPAREAGFQGVVRLSLHLNYLGELLDAKIKASSGYKVLDEDALTVASGIVSYPPFPSSMEQKDLWVDVPILYRLD